MDIILYTGNVHGRKAVLEILEAGMQASDPYNNTRKLIRIENGKLICGNRDFEPMGTPNSGDEVYDLSTIERIYVFGAGKSIQRVAKAIEDVLGDRLTGGHCIDKKGHPVILERIGVTLGGHPAPDEAIYNLKQWGAWEEVPSSVRRHLEDADPKHESVHLISTPHLYQSTGRGIYKARYLSTLQKISIHSS